MCLPLSSSRRYGRARPRDGREASPGNGTRAPVASQRRMNHEERDLNPISTRCCIAGGGPAGMMLGLLLARAGVPVLVLEKHADFLRDFRGDTIHPSTLEILDELGLADRFLALPHSKVSTIMLRSTSGQTISYAVFCLTKKRRSLTRQRG